MAGKYTDYEQYTDDELIDRIRRGETEITDYICDKRSEEHTSELQSLYS